MEYKADTYIRDPLSESPFDMGDVDATQSSPSLSRLIAVIRNICCAFETMFTTAMKERKIQCTSSEKYEHDINLGESPLPNVNGQAHYRCLRTGSLRVCQPTRTDIKEGRVTYSSMSPTRTCSL